VQQSLSNAVTTKFSRRNRKRSRWDEQFYHFITLLRVIIIVTWCLIIRENHNSGQWQTAHTSTYWNLYEIPLTQGLSTGRSYKPSWCLSPQKEKKKKKLGSCGQILAANSYKDYTSLAFFLNPFQNNYVAGKTDGFKAN